MIIGGSAVTTHRATFPSSMDTLRILHDDATDPISIRPAAASSPCTARKKTLSGHFLDDDDAKPSRRSTGSLREDNEWARHTFAALPSRLCEIARRSTEEQYEMGSYSLPPRSAPSSVFRTSAQLQQYRAYGTACDGTELPKENEQAGGAFLQVTNPDPESMWIRGKAAGVEWLVLDPSIETVTIELLQQGSPASTVMCKNAPNNGGFLYTKVPWGMPCGDGYFLRISCSTDPTRYMTTRLFSIGTDA